MQKILRSIATFSLLLFSSLPTCQASLATFVLNYSGADLGNPAQAQVLISFDDSYVSNPQDGLQFLYAGSAITAFTLTVTGAASGNGNFGLSDYDVFTWDTAGATLDFSENLVGQSTGGGGWGTTQDYLTGAFNFFALDSSPNAPTATLNAFQIATSGGNGDVLNLTSFSPAPVTVPIPSAFLMLLGGLLPLISVWAQGRRR